MYFALTFEYYGFYNSKESSGKCIKCDSLISQIEQLLNFLNWNISAKLANITCVWHIITKIKHKTYEWFANDTKIDSQKKELKPDLQGAGEKISKSIMEKAFMKMERRWNFLRK